MRILGFILILFVGPLMAQDGSSRFTRTFEKAPMIEILGEVSDAFKVQVYYHPDWFDSLEYSGTFSNADLDEVLDGLFAGSAIATFVDGDKVFLTYNTRIVSDLGILGFYDQGEAQELSETEVVFTREYGNQSGESGEEDRVFEIGRIGLMDKGKDVTIAGYVKEAETGNPVEGALVYIQDPFIGTTAGEDGFYSLSVPTGKQILHFQSLNMKNTFRNVVAFSDGRLDVNMNIDIIALKSVVVNAERDINITNPTMGVTRIDVKESKNVPVLLGERDLVKIATTTSGVQTAGEGAAGINIRGGKADQNLFLLDGTPIYNTSHFFGFFSVFNAEAIGSMDLYKSAIPAQYGGRLSSVFDLRSKEPNKEQISGSGGIGPVTSNLLLEIPIFKNKTGLMLGGRATYSDYVLKRIKSSPLGNNEVAFYDIIGKLHHRFSDKSQISLSGYHSFDSFQLASDSLLSYTDFSYTNTNFSLIWDYRFGDKLDGKFNAAVSQYNYSIGYDVLPTQAFDISFFLQEWTGSADFNYYYLPYLNFTFGASAKRFDVNPGERIPLGGESLITKDKVEDEQALQFDAHVSAQFDPTDRIALSAGIRYNVFSVLGPGAVYSYDQGSDSPQDSTYYSKGESIVNYHGPEWRLSGRYTINSTTSLKASINRTRQNVHLMINAASIAPTDIWRLSSAHIEPQVADQFSVGLYKNYERKHIIETSLELYYKKIQNLIDFKVGADLQFNKAIETDVLQGPGKSYGAEFSVKKSSGWFTGWVNYTLSRSLIQLDGPTPSETVNEGEFFPTNYDRPHYLNVVTNYKFTRRFSMSVNAVYSTGRPITYPVGKWTYRGVENIHYSNRNEFRLPDYVRIDLGVNLEGSHKIKKLAHSFWSFSIYNLLGRDNVYSIFFNVEEGEVSGYKMTIFPSPIPTVTYNFSF